MIGAGPVVLIDAFAQMAFVTPRDDRGKQAMMSTPIEY
jgi:hypothetical protein